MKELIKYSAFLVVLFLGIGCNNDDDLQTIQLNEPFTAVIDQKYICNTTDGEIVIEITDIKDERVRGEELCDVIFYPGEAIIYTDISFKEHELSEELFSRGCTTTDGTPSNNTLSSIELENEYILRILSVKPYSTSLTANDNLTLDDYQIKFVIIK